MLHSAPKSTSQLNWWTCAASCVVNHSGQICLLSSFLLRLLTCTVCIWWNGSFRDFTLRRCSMLFADMELHTAAFSSVLLLLVPSVNKLLQALFFHVLQCCHVLFSLLCFAATLEVSLLPTLVAFSIFSWAVLLLGYDGVAQQQ